MKELLLVTGGADFSREFLPEFTMAMAFFNSAKFGKMVRWSI
jgi:hypothetical protein